MALTPALQDRLAVAAQARQQPASVVIRDLLDAHLPQLPEGVAP